MVKEQSAGSHRATKAGATNGTRRNMAQARLLNTRRMDGSRIIDRAGGCGGQCAAPGRAARTRTPAASARFWAAAGTRRWRAARANRRKRRPAPASDSYLARSPADLLHLRLRGHPARTGSASDPCTAPGASRSACSPCCAPGHRLPPSAARLVPPRVPHRPTPGNRHATVGAPGGPLAVRGPGPAQRHCSHDTSTGRVCRAWH